jgi:3-oxoacyl-[acyl-carrier-protein] synthase II
MKLALNSAQIEKSQIDFISAHGTSTPLNDRIETLAIKKLFENRAYHIPVSSLKSQLGHSTIAAAAVEAISSFLMIEEQKLAPTINLNNADPDCDLDYVPNNARDSKVDRILSNSFGFGGQNACIVMEKWKT